MLRNALVLVFILSRLAHPAITERAHTLKMSSGIGDDSHELSDMSQGKTREANVEHVAESIDRDDLDRDQLAKLGKKSVLRVRRADFP